MLTRRVCIVCSGEFDRDIEEVIEEEELELDLPEDDARSEDSYTYEEQPSSQSIAGLCDYAGLNRAKSMYVITTIA